MRRDRAAGDRRRAEEAGFHHHLVKPVNPDELLRVMSEAHRRPARPA